jgi:hypothetical protein
MSEARHQHKRADHAEQEAATKQKSIDNILDGQAKANALAKAEKRRVEATYAQIQKDNAHALTLARADADARLRDWMRTHRADQGGSGKADLPRHSDTASGPDADAGSAFVVGARDLEICTAASVQAAGWRAWWADIQASQAGNK